MECVDDESKKMLVHMVLGRRSLGGRGGHVPNPKN